MSNKHPDWENVFTITPEFMAEAMGNLKYDELANFLSLLAQKIGKDCVADKERGRPKLSSHLEKASAALERSSEEIKNAWGICESRMK